MSQGFLMGLDAGGGGGRALVVDVELGTVTSAFRSWSHPVAPGSGGLGFDLDLPAVWNALAEAAREARERAGASPEQVLGIAATSMRETVVVLDAAGESLYAGPNRDARAAGEGIRLSLEHGDELYARTGHWPWPIFAAPRLQWFGANVAGAWDRADTFLCLNEWIACRLCGERAGDLSQAGESLLFDITTREWAWDWIDRLGIPRGLFPELRPAGSLLGGLGREAADALGLRSGTPVAIGGADSQCGLLGAGAVQPGEVAVVAGTSSPIQLVLDEPCIDPQARLWSGLHVVPDCWVLESNAGPTGETLDWLARILYPDDPHPTAHLLAEAGRSEPGALGMLSSVGAQVMNAREVAFPVASLTLSHMIAPADPSPRRHLVRSVVEGQAYALRANLEQLVEVSGRKVEPLRLAGGMARSATFRGILADVVGGPVRIAPTPEASALGAALCAGVAVGVDSDLVAAGRRVARRALEHAPDAANSKVYDGLYGQWRELRKSADAAEGAARNVILPAVLRASAEAPSAAEAPPRPRILVTADLDDEGLAALRALGDVEYASFRDAMRLLTGDSLVEALRDFEVFVTEIDVVGADALAKLPELRVIATCRGDAVNVDIPTCSALGIPVLNAPGRNADAVADLTLAFFLALARNLGPASAFLREPGGIAGDMGRMGQAFSRFQGRELWRKTVGLVGVGAVGRGVARRARAFGARILGYDPYADPESVAELGAESVSLDRLLAESDFVSLHAPVTDETRGMIGATQLERMKTSAFLVNTARAALLDEAALVEALRQRKLAGAALDVFDVEPPGADHPLLQLENVIATPHLGGNTVDVAAHQGRIIADDLARLLRGEPARNLLNAAALGDFEWRRERPPVDAETLSSLAERSAPAVSDLQKEQRPAKEPKVQQPKASAPNSGATATNVDPAIAERMKAILEDFLSAAEKDSALTAAATGKDVTLHFDLSDLGLDFIIRLRDDRVVAGLGAPDEGGDVQLRLRADVFDGMFTNRVNPMQAAMDGRLSFSGDTAKAMTLQALQRDLARLYREAVARVGDPGDLASLPDPDAVAGAAAAAPTQPGDERDQLIQVVKELYEIQVITATGGNVSMRIPGADALWITPSQLFKGDLRPEVLVRIDLDGEALDRGARSPSSERLMHTAVYQARPEAGAVIHAHAPNATILANTDLPFLPISTEAAFFDDIPRIPFIMPGTRELADAVGEAARRSWAVLLKNHGLLVAGRSLRRAADMVEIVERSAEIILGCYAVGKEPPVLPEDVVKTLRKMGDLIA